MKILVKVKTGAREEKIESAGNGEFKIWVQERPEKGKANEAVRKVLARHLGVVQWRVELRSGFPQNQKFLRFFKQSPSNFLLGFCFRQHSDILENVGVLC